MAALKETIDALVQVPGPLREFYAPGDDGKFHLSVDGEQPKVAEFRQNNINLMRERDALRAEAEADKAKLAELLAKPDGATQAAKLEADLAAERAAHASTRLRHIVTSEFLSAGGRASAVDFIAAEAEKVFALEDGKVTTKEFSPANPAAPLSIEEWMRKQMLEKEYVFQPSRGGGAAPRGGPVTRFGERPSQKVLKDPTPQALGANAAAIARGDIKIEHSS